MSVNSSSSSNASLPPSPLSSSFNVFSLFHHCFSSTAGTLSITAFTIISVLLLLPLYVYVVYLGLQRWRQHRSNTTTNHADVFTYHMVVAELMSILGFSIMFCGSLTDLPQMMVAGTYLFFLNLYGQRFFHILTCVERYLAVVHPITYLSLKNEKGVRIRNITIGCAWLLSFAGIALINIDNKFMAAVNFSIGSLIFIVVSFCSLSVLYVLTRPGPGEGGGGRQQVDQSKLRAFYIIMIILGVLVFRFVGLLITTALINSPQLLEDQRCGVCFSTFWFSMPSSLVLPLLFLQRAGKLPCCKKNNE